MTTLRPDPPAAASAEAWTTRRLLAWMTGRFTDRGIDAPRVVAEMLLAHVIGCERMRLYMEADRRATEAERSRLRDLVRRAADHEPVQYLVGEAWFFSRPFHVDGTTLIPRPSTETLVEHVLQWHRRRIGADAIEPDPPADAEPNAAEPAEAAPAAPPAPLDVADIGTGSGCIAISIAAQLPGARVVATDLVPAALDLARRNAERHGVADRIDLRPGDGLEPLGPAADGGGFDVICSNPPYIPDDEWATVDRNVRDFEPETALRGGPDGLDVIRPLVAGVAPHLRPGGLLAVEIAHVHRDGAMDLAAAAGLRDIDVLRDHEGLWRVLVGRR